MVSASINATDSLTNLVETKISKAPVMAPAIPSGIGKVFRVVLKAFKEGDKFVYELPYEKFTNITDIVVKQADQSKKITINDAFGYALIEELERAGIVIEKFHLANSGDIVKKVFLMYGEDVVKNKQNLEDLHYLAKGIHEYGIAKEIFEADKNVTLAELVNQTKAIVNKSKRPKLKFGSIKPKETTTPNKNYADLLLKQNQPANIKTPLTEEMLLEYKNVTSFIHKHDERIKLSEAVEILQKPMPEDFKGIQKYIEAVYVKGVNEPFDDMELLNLNDSKTIETLVTYYHSISQGFNNKITQSEKKKLFTILSSLSLQNEIQASPGIITREAFEILKDEKVLINLLKDLTAENKEVSYKMMNSLECSPVFFTAIGKIDIYKWINTPSLRGASLKIETEADLRYYEAIYGGYHILEKDKMFHAMTEFIGDLKGIKASRARFTSINTVSEGYQGLIGLRKGAYKAIKKGDFLEKDLSHHFDKIDEIILKTQEDKKSIIDIVEYLKKVFSEKALTIEKKDWGNICIINGERFFIGHDKI